MSYSPITHIWNGKMCCKLCNMPHGECRIGKLYSPTPNSYENTH